MDWDHLGGCCGRHVSAVRGGVAVLFKLGGHQCRRFYHRDGDNQPMAGSRAKATKAEQTIPEEVDAQQANYAKA